MSATQKINRKPKVPTMAYFVCRLMIDPRTGAEVGCYVPASQTDRDILRAKKVRIGDRCRMAPKKPRNEKFHRLVHGLGTLMVEQVDGFDDVDAHGAIKRLQEQSGVMCDTVAYTLPGNLTISRTEPRSIAFDEMDEGDFHLFWQGICRYIVSRYWPSVDPGAIESMIPMMPETPA